MNRGRTLVMTSLLAILFFSIHLADDIVRGFEEGNLSNLPAFAILVVWLYGTVVLGDRRSGHVIMLLGALLGCGVPVIHMAGIGIGVDGPVGRSSGAFLFVWTLIALGTTALFSAVLSAQELWRLRRGVATTL